MNVIKLKVDFTNRIINQEGVYLVEGDYNSTKLVFEFDKDYEGTKIFEMAKPNTMQAIFVSEIIDNEVVLVAKDENENNVSIFTEAGKYIYEISLYDGDSKLTSISGTLPVAKEMVKIADAEVETYLPVFDQLMQELNTATEAANVAIEEANNLDIDVEKEDKVATVTITKKDGTTKSVEIYDGQGGGGGTSNHAELENLDFDNSGHTGFQRAGNYIEEETDPTVPQHVKNIQQTDINNWNNKADMEDIPDVSQFITNAANNLINYYLKTETYTKQEVNNLIGQIQTVHIEVVQTLPTTGQSNIIYLVSKTGSTGDVYNEYIYVNNAWELIGSTEVDLTGYAKETWVNQQIANFLTRAEIEALIPTQLADLTEDSTHRTVTDTEKTNWNNKSDFSGNYNDLTNKPTIPTVPTNVSAFTNDAGYLTQHQDISGKENSSNKVTVISASSTDTQYCSAKCVYDLVGNIESLLGGI